MKRVLVIGGDAAGMSAAAQAQRGQEPVTVTVVERSAQTSVAACGLPYLIGGAIEASSRLVIRSADQHRAAGIVVHTRTEATSLDLEARQVAARELDSGASLDIPFDELVIATGASALRPPIPGIDANGVFVVHTLADGEAITQAIAQRSPLTAVVVGGGYIGLEMVEALLAKGLNVTLVERLDQPMATMDPDMGERIAHELLEMGVGLKLQSTVEGFSIGQDGWVNAVTTDKGEVAADLVIVALGVRPNVELARHAGLAIGPTGAIATDPRMATSHPSVWAAGDCVETVHRVSQRPAWVALGTHANKQGRVVGINLAGGHARFPGVIGTAVTKVGSVEIARTGLTVREAHAAGFDPVGETVSGKTRAHYYPDGAQIAVKVIAERTTGRMLGAQVVGGAESAKRIDALAVAIWNNMTAEDFAQLDLGYAPPFAPVWDTPLIAARKAARSE
jgi:NADPH-dependent 2,4-dienoyl-CoA reductase/sulfur reductase-like enzyme